MKNNCIAKKVGSVASDVTPLPVDVREFTILEKLKISKYSVSPTNNQTKFANKIVFIGNPYRFDMSIIQTYSRNIPI